MDYIVDFMDYVMDSYGHDDGLNIHNLWNRGLYYGYGGLCYGLPMDYTVDCFFRNF